MTTQDWITLLSAVLVAVGWFVNGFFDRRLSIAEKRLEYRLEALKSFLPVISSLHSQRENFFNNPESISQLRNARWQFELYGKTIEIEAFESMMQAMGSNNVELFLNKVQEVISLVLTQIRKELRIS